MRNIFAIIIICITFFACKPGVPRNVIQPDIMEKVLFDIHVVDGYISTLSKPDTAKIVASSYYRGVYKKFDIDSAKYTKSLNYYYDHPEVLNKIFLSLQKQFEEEKKRNDKILEQESAAIQRINFAKLNPALTVPVLIAGPRRFNFAENPFTLTLPAVN